MQQTIVTGKVINVSKARSTETTDDRGPVSSFTANYQDEMCMD